MNAPARELLRQPLRKVAAISRIDIPVKPGVYAVYRGGRLLYVGESRRGLRSRLWGNHLRGNARGSTLRNKVAKALALASVGERAYGRAAEALISEKLRECDVRFLAVAVVEIGATQADLIRELDPPMNDHPGQRPRWRIDEAREILGIDVSAGAQP